MHTQSLCWQGNMRIWKVLNSVSTAQQQLKHWCVISIFFFLVNSKHCTILAITKEINCLSQNHETMVRSTAKLITTVEKKMVLELFYLVHCGVETINQDNVQSWLAYSNNTFSPFVSRWKADKPTFVKTLGEVSRSEKNALLRISFKNYVNVK